jgi:hypothetical protein
MDTAPRFGGFTLRTDCNACGQPVPLNGPAEHAHCDSCQKELALPSRLWSAVLEELAEAHDQLADGAGKAGTRDVSGFQLHYSYRRATPRCEKCQQPFATDRLAPGSARDFCCVHCGDGASTAPVPPWLRTLVPTATQIYSVDRGLAQAEGAGPAPAVADAPRPVVMACPQCGGSLRLTSEAARLLPCQFCKTDVYLPDELWRRLHPARIAREWYVRFDGKTRAQLDAEAAAQSKAARAERDARERAERAERDAAAAFTRAHEESLAAERLDVEITALIRRGYAACAVLWAVMGTTAAWAWLAPQLEGVTHEVALEIGLPLVGVSLVVLFVTLFIASRPVKVRTKYDGTMMMFIVWFFVIFGLTMPVFGSVMCLVVAIKRFTGTLGGSTIRSGGSVTHYKSIKMLRGETYPLGVAYLALALLWPAIIFGLSQTHADGPTKDDPPAQQRRSGAAHPELR